MSTTSSPSRLVAPTPPSFNSLHPRDHNFPSYPPDHSSPCFVDKAAGHSKSHGRPKLQAAATYPAVEPYLSAVFVASKRHKPNLGEPSIMKSLSFPCFR